MSITLTYTFANIEELQAHLAGKHATAGVVKTEPAPTKKPTTVAEPSAPAAGVASTASSTAQNGQSADAGEGCKTYTVDDAKALTMKIVAARGRDTAVELLKKYGVPVAAKLPADQIAAFCAEAEGVLA